MPQEQTQDFLNPHAIQDHAIYTTKDLIRLFRVAPKTVSAWFRLGLEYTPMTPGPKSRRLVFGRSLREFLTAYGMAMKIVSLMGDSNGEEIEEEETEG